jgi:hypothetical protein
MIKIYTLAHPLTNEIRYIGKTKYSLKTRLCKHLITYEKNHRANWIRKLQKENLKPIIELLEEVDEDNWKSAEIYWIFQFRTWGFRLLNATEGGETGIISENCRKAHKAKVKGSKRKKSSIELTVSALRKPVLQYSKDMKFIFEYISASEAARKTNTQLSHITECCNNKLKRKSANGYIWKYKN